MAICLCHQIDKAMTSYLERKDREFTTEGGIRERMTAARLEQRATQKETIDQQAQEISALRKEVVRLRTLLLNAGISPDNPENPDIPDNPDNPDIPEIRENNQNKQTI